MREVASVAGADLDHAAGEAGEQLRVVRLAASAVSFDAEALIETREDWMT